MSTEPASDAAFRHRLTVITFGLLLVVLVIHLLQMFSVILLPLLIAAMIAYAILPAHRWLVRRGIRSAMAYFVLLALLLAAFLLMGNAVYDSIASITPQKLDDYRIKLNRKEARWVRFVEGLGLDASEVQFNKLVDKANVSRDSVVGTVRGLAGTFVGFVTFALIVFIYLVFLMAEKLTFSRRLALAFGDVRATEVLLLAQAINEAIINYIAVKTWISFVTGVLSFVAFGLLGVEFAFFWGVLIFLLNFVPYLGSLVAMVPPVILAFLQFDSIWPVPILIGLLVSIQLFTGQFLEPRMAGSRLNLSPLLILLSLAFWGYLWGVGGMLVAVPLTVVIKIVLDHIPETRPIGTLMSNV